MSTHIHFTTFYKALDSLNPWQLCAVGTSLAEQSWPNLALFAEITHFESVDSVRHCQNLLWDHVAGLQPSKNFEQLIERLDLVTPDPEEFDFFGVQPAIDAITAIHCALQCAMKPSAEDVASIMTLSLSTIAKMIQYTEEVPTDDVELEEYHEKHALYLAQMSFMTNVIKLVKNEKKQSPKSMSKIRCFAKNDDTSQLGIAL